MKAEKIAQIQAVIRTYDALIDILENKAGQFVKFYEQGAISLDELTREILPLNNEQKRIFVKRGLQIRKLEKISE